MAKSINPRFFAELRKKVEYKYPIDHLNERDEFNTLVRAERERSVRKLTKDELVSIILDNKGLPKIDTEAIRAKIGLAPERAALLKRIDEAELRSLAGDDAAALALINDILN